MIISKENSERRLSNPMNLLNKSNVANGENKRQSAMSLFIRPAVEIKNVTPKVEIEQPVELINSEVATPPVANEEIKTSSLSLALSKITNKPSDKEIPAEVSVATSLVDNLLESADAKIELAQAHNKAITLMGKAINKLEQKLDGDAVPAKMLPSIISGLGRVVTDIRKEQAERNKSEGNETVHYHFYCPEQKPLEQFEVIEVG